MAQEDVVGALLTQAETALSAGDQRAGSILINQALKRDFTNERAWRLLYRLIGSKRPFEVFQVEFATKYYPDRLYLLPGARVDWQKELDQ